MSKLIIYQPGELVGSCMYLRDVEPEFSKKGEMIRYALFKCMRCGENFTTSIASVKHGFTRSCGCLKREFNTKRLTKHGLRHHPLYNKWCEIKNRCYNKNEPTYKYYGGRGIKMCNEWLDSPKKFIDDISNLDYFGAPGRTLDRHPDNNGNYKPGNVRWATKKEQANNRRSKGSC